MLILYCMVDVNGGVWVDYDVVDWIVFFLICILVYVVCIELFIIIFLFLLMMLLEKCLRGYCEIIVE